MELQKIILKTEREIIAPLFNEALNANLRVVDFELSNISDNTTSIPGNTYSKLVITNGGSAYTGEHDIYYDRVDAEDLFYMIKKHLPFGYNQITVGSVQNFLIQYYGLVCTSDTVEKVEVNADEVTVFFKADSPIVTGKLAFTYNNTAQDLAVLLANNDLGQLGTPGVVAGVPNASYYSYRYDMSYAVALLSVMEVGDPANAELAELYSGVTGDNWVFDPDTPSKYNLGGAELVFTGDAMESDAAGWPTNMAYHQVCVFRLGAQCTNLGGYLLMNMAMPMTDVV